MIQFSRFNYHDLNSSYFPSQHKETTKLCTFSEHELKRKYLFVHICAWTKNITHIYTQKSGLYQIIKWWSNSKWMRSMWYYKQNYNLNQIGTDTIHAIIPKKYQKYPSTTILKHVNMLAEVSKFNHVCLYNMTPYKDVQYYNPRMHNGHIVH